MKRTIAILLLILVSSTVYSQSDSTDLNLYMTDPILADEMDSLMYDVNEFGEMYLECDIEDTVYFDGLNIEISYAYNHQILYKGVFSKSDLITENLLDPNWHLTLDLGKLEKNTSYIITFVTHDINGLSSAIISKQFTYAGN